MATKAARKIHTKSVAKEEKSSGWDLCLWEGTKMKRRLCRDRRLSRGMSGLRQELNVPVLGSYAGKTRYPWLLGELLRQVERLEKTRHHLWAFMGVAYPQRGWREICPCCGHIGTPPNLR